MKGLEGDGEGREGEEGLLLSGGCFIPEIIEVGVSILLEAGGGGGSQRVEGNGNAMCLLRGFGAGDDLPGMWS